MSTKTMKFFTSSPSEVQGNNITYCPFTHLDSDSFNQSVVGSNNNYKEYNKFKVKVSNASVQSGLDGKDQNFQVYIKSCKSQCVCTENFSMGISEKSTIGRYHANNKLQYEIEKKRYKTSNPKVAPMKYVSSVNKDDKLKPPPMDWNNYHRLAVIHNFLDELEYDLPSICTVGVIGKSLEGRDLKTLKISNSDAKNGSIWIDAGIHAREWIAPAVATFVANYIAKNFKKLPKSMTNKDWYFLPVMNPDGYEYSHTQNRMWRKNRAWHGRECVGVDLNRNFSFGWGRKGSSDDPKHNFYRGPEPFSEPESCAVRDVISKSGISFKVYITLHSYGEVILFPYAFQDQLCPDYIQLLEGATVMSKAIHKCNGNIYRVGTSRDVMYGASGTSNDWSHGVAQIPYCYLIELRTLNIWREENSMMDIMVEGTRTGQMAGMLHERDIPFSVAVKDVNFIMEREKEKFVTKRITKPIEFRRKMDWTSYHRLDAIYDFMDNLVRDYPYLCTIKVIGKTVEGRDLRMLVISNGESDNVPVWIDGSIHPREWISTAVVTYLADRIVRTFNEQPLSVTNKDWYIVPVLNPDGYEYTHTHDRMWRKNRGRFGECIGVDLNRNFSYGFGEKGEEGSSDDPGNIFYRGPGPFSEPVSAAVKRAILKSDKQFKVFLSFHSYGEVIIFPWGYTSDPCPDYVKLLEGGATMAKAIYDFSGRTYKVGSTKDLMYFAAGNSTDWSYAVAGIPYSYMLELRGKEHKFLLPKEEILDSSKEVFYGVTRLMDYVDQK